MSNHVKEVGERNRKAMAINHLQQLRLRAPEMKRKEYEGLLEKVAQRREHSDERSFNQSSTPQPSMKEKALGKKTTMAKMPSSKAKLAHL